MNDTLQGSGMNDRLGYIDCAKGIGIILVVIAHHLQDSPEVLLWIPWQRT